MTTRSRRTRLARCIVVIALLAAVVVATPQALAAPRSVLGNVTLSPTSFYAGAGSTTLGYTLSGQATVSVSVRNKAGATVRTLRPAAAQAAGTYSVTWDGRAEGGTSLPAGGYSVVVVATTSSGTVQSTKSVQLLAPLLTGVSTSPAAFYAGSGSTTLKYTLSAKATVSVVVRDVSSATVRTLRPATVQAAGTYSRVWDGKSDGGVSLPAGSYSILVTATTSAGTVQSAQNVQLVAPVLTEVGLSPTSFYAGSGSTTLSYTLAGPATVAVTVRDSSGTVVRTLQTAFQVAGTYPLVWDGKADGGTSVPAGGYSLVVAATTVAGTEQSAQNAQVLAPVLGGVGVSPAAFYAGSGSTTLTYALAGPATVAVAVRDASGTVVRTLQPATAQAAGTHTLVWDGTADGGASLSAGSYAVSVSASTAVGALESTQSVQLVAPVLTGVGLSPASFRAGSGSTNVTYTLIGPATVVVSALDAGGTKVATVQPSTALDAGSYSVTWDGRADGGASLPAGGYSIVVKAATAVGTLESAQSVELLAPVLTGVGVVPAAFYVGAGSTTVSYTLTEPATASVAVTDAGGATVRTLQPATAQAAGSFTLVWDGKCRRRRRACPPVPTRSSSTPPPRTARSGASRRCSW